LVQRLPEAGVPGILAAGDTPLGPHRPPQRHPAGGARARFREAEALGYTDFWSAESDVDPWIVLGLGAAWTTRALLGTAIVGAFTRGPAIIAIGAAAWGRSRAGTVRARIGSGSNVTVERWNSGRFEKPLTRVTEVVKAVRQALDGEAMAVQGETLSVSGFRLGRPCRRGCRSTWRALQERMGGRPCALPTASSPTGSPPTHVTQVAARSSDEARKVGKDPETYPIVVSDQRLPEHPAGQRAARGPASSSAAR